MTTREQALEWWNKLDIKTWRILCDKHLNQQNFYKYKSCHFLTGGEIEEIWRKETENNSPLDSFSPEDFSNDESNPTEQQVNIERDSERDADIDYKGYSSISEEEPQIDFEMLLALVEQFDNLSKLIPSFEPLLNNGKLFFKLLSTKPTFAKKAFKELNKLNK